MCVLHSNDERCSSLVNETSSINFVFQDIDLWMNIDAIGILFTWKMFRILFSIEILSSFYSNILLVFSSLHQFRAKQPTFVFWLCLCFYWVRVLKRAIGFLCGTFAIQITHNHHENDVCFMSIWTRLKTSFGKSLNKRKVPRWK